MAITDKNRKILWARSGNRCAKCKVRLVEDRTHADAESVVGEECHIISGSPEGPRYDPNFPADQIDSLDNHILLCASDHKVIDDQSATYTPADVRTMKAEHEKWVEDRFDNAQTKPVRVRRVEGNVPQYLIRITSGKDLLTMVSGCMAHSFDHEHDLTEEEIELVGGFGQEVSDWIDLASDLEPLESVRMSAHLHQLLQHLEAKGFFVFGARETRRLGGGSQPPTAFPVLHLAVMRSSNPTILHSQPVEAVESKKDGPPVATV